MDYKVLVTQEAEADLDKYLWYLIYKKGNRQAAKNMLDDFEETKDHSQPRTFICTAYVLNFTPIVHFLLVC